MEDVISSLIRPRCYRSAYSLISEMLLSQLVLAIIGTKYKLWMPFFFRMTVAAFLIGNVLLHFKFARDSNNKMDKF